MSTTPQRHDSTNGPHETPFEPALFAGTRCTYVILPFLIALLTCSCFSTTTRADVLIVADEFPAMEVLAKRLKTEEHVASQIVDQTHLPSALTNFSAVVVYIHLGMSNAAEHAFIDYAKGGGRLVLLHHSISSGKRRNKDWFGFLGVQLPEAPVEQGGYKWIEGVTVDWVNLAPRHYIMTNKVSYSGFKDDSSLHRIPSRSLPFFVLSGTEVYLNHQLSGPRTLLMGLQYKDKASGAMWIQDTAGWLRPAEKGWVIYFMPGHTARDFEDPAYGRIVLNAMTAPATALTR